MSIKVNYAGLRFLRDQLTRSVNDNGELVNGSTLGLGILNVEGMDDVFSNFLTRLNDNTTKVNGDVDDELGSLELGEVLLQSTLVELNTGGFAFVGNKTLAWMKESTLEDVLRGTDTIKLTSIDSAFDNANTGDTVEVAQYCAYEDTWSGDGIDTIDDGGEILISSTGGMSVGAKNGDDSGEISNTISRMTGKTSGNNFEKSLAEIFFVSEIMSSTVDITKVVDGEQTEESYDALTGEHKVTISEKTVVIPTTATRSLAKVSATTGRFGIGSYINQLGKLLPYLGISELPIYTSSSLSVSGGLVSVMTDNRDNINSYNSPDIGFNPRSATHVSHGVETVNGFGVQAVGCDITSDASSHTMTFEAPGSEQSCPVVLDCYDQWRSRSQIAHTWATNFLTYIWTLRALSESKCNTEVPLVEDDTSAGGIGDSTAGKVGVINFDCKEKDEDVSGLLSSDYSALYSLLNSLYNGANPVPVYSNDWSQVDNRDYFVRIHHEANPDAQKLMPVSLGADIESLREIVGISSDIKDIKGVIAAITNFFLDINDNSVVKSSNGAVSKLSVKKAVLAETGFDLGIPTGQIGVELYESMYSDLSAWVLNVSNTDFKSYNTQMFEAFKTANDGLSRTMQATKTYSGVRVKTGEKDVEGNDIYIWQDEVVVTEEVEVSWGVYSYDVSTMNKHIAAIIQTRLNVIESGGTSE